MYIFIIVGFGWLVSRLLGACLCTECLKAGVRLPIQYMANSQGCTVMSSDFELLASQQSPTETAPGSVPASVERAMATNFGIPISGFLCSVVFDQSINCLVGIVYRESRGRFRDGSTIRTSTVRRRLEHGAYHLIQTRNGSTYVICDWALEGGSPQFEGALH
jgi:hypothetical protein